MRISITHHALYRLNERGISELEVKDTIRYAKHESSGKGIFSAENGDIKVIFRKETKNKILVITAYRV